MTGWFPQVRKVEEGRSRELRKRRESWPLMPAWGGERFRVCLQWFLGTYLSPTGRFSVMLAATTCTYFQVSLVDQKKQREKTYLSIFPVAHKPNKDVKDGHPLHSRDKNTIPPLRAKIGGCNTMTKTYSPTFMSSGVFILFSRGNTVPARVY